jgi:hypothetical protein
VSVRSITRKLVGDKFKYAAAGPHYKQLASSLRGVVQGSVKDEYGWCERVVDMIANLDAGSVSGLVQFHT